MISLRLLVKFFNIPFSPPIALIWGVLFLTVFTITAYYPATEAGFILDDKNFFLEDPLIKAPDGFRRIWFSPLENNNIWPYLPITRTTFWLENQIWGINLKITHWINITLHLISAILLWLGLRGLQVQGAWFVGALFAVHPLHVQSVAWIAERKNVVAGIFYLLCLWSYWCFEKKRSWWWYLITLGVFLCALLSKTATIMLPVVLIFGRLWLRTPWKLTDFLRLVPFFSLSLGIGYLRIWFEIHSFGASDSQISSNYLERILIAGHIPFFYLSKLFFPYPIIFNYPKWILDSTQISMYLPVISLTLISGILLRKYQTWGRAPFLGLGAFGVMLFPILGFFNNSWFQYSFVANHWVYLASIPVFILSFQGLIGIEKNISVGQEGFNKYMLKTVWIPILIGLGMMTWNLSSTYKDHETLWKATIARNAASWLAHFNLGTDYLNQKRYSLALESLSTAIGLKHDLVQAYNNRGIVYLHLHQYVESIEDFNQILRLNPADVGAYNHRGHAYLKLKKYQLALQDYNKAILLQPDYPLSYDNRGNVLADLGQYQQALEDFTRAIALKPNFPEAYNHRGLAYFVLNEYQKAMQNYQKALQLKPDFANAYYNQGIAYFHFKQFEKSIEKYTRALQFNPEFVEAYRDRGLAYAKLQQYEASIQDFNRALQIKPDLAEIYYYRALSYSALEQYAQSLEDYTKAIQLQPTTTWAYINRGILYMTYFKKREEACQDWEKACELGQCQNYHLAQNNEECN